MSLTARSNLKDLTERICPAFWCPAAVAAVTLLGSWLRMAGLSDISLRGDEAFTVTFSRLPLQEMVRTLLLTEPHPPLYYTTLHVWMQWAGQSEIAARFPSVFFGIVAIPLTYRLGVMLSASRLVGLAAALFVALNPYLVWHSQDARMYTLLAAACTASTVFGLRLAAWADLGTGAGTVTWWAYVLTTVAALFSHYGAVFALAAQGLAWLVLWVAGRAGGRTGRGSMAALRWPAGMMVSVVCLLPWAWLAAPMMLGHTKGWIAEVGLGDLVNRSLQVYSLGTTAGYSATEQSMIFLAAAAIGLVVAARRSLLAFAVAVVLAVTPLAVAFVLSLQRPMFDERYLLFVIPVYAVMVAWGVSALERSKSGGVGRAGLALGAVSVLLIAAAVALSVASLRAYYTDPAYAKSPGWREFVETIVVGSRQGDRVIQNFPDPSLPYYLDGRLPMEVIPSSGPLQAAAAEKQLTAQMARGGRLWFLPYDSMGWDESGFVEKWLDSHARPIRDELVGGIRLKLYETSAPPGGKD